MSTKKTQEFCLTSDEEAILLGCLLGDGHIEKRGNSYRFKIRHCAKQQGYVDWKYEQLKRLCNKKPKIVANGKDKAYSAAYFNSRSGSYLKKYHELFYKLTNPPNQKPRYKKKFLQN